MAGKEGRGSRALQGCAGGPRAQGGLDRAGEKRMGRRVTGWKWIKSTTFYKVAHSEHFYVLKPDPHNIECLGNSSLDIDVMKAGAQPNLRAGAGAVKMGSHASQLEMSFLQTTQKHHHLK